MAFYCNSPPDRSGFIPKTQVIDCFQKDFKEVNCKGWFSQPTPLTGEAGPSGPPKFLSFVEVPWVQKLINQQVNNDAQDENQADIQAEHQLAPEPQPVLDVDLNNPIDPVAPVEEPDDAFIEMNDFVNMLMEEEEEIDPNPNDGMIQPAQHDMGQISFSVSQQPLVSDPSVNMMPDLNVQEQGPAQVHQQFQQLNDNPQVPHMHMQELVPEFPMGQELEEMLQPPHAPILPAHVHMGPQQMELQQDPVNINIHAGMALIHLPEANPVFVNRRDEQNMKINADIYRLWARHFSPADIQKPMIQIPDDWLAFFTTMLLSPSHFSWAKDFLNSKAWNIFLTVQGPNKGLNFQIPITCPQKNAPTCFLQDMENTDSMITGMPTKEPPATSENTKGKSIYSSHTVPLPKQVLHCKGPMVETEVRRSDRIRAQNQGFKRGSCTHRNCLACSNEPPVLHPDLIKNLGTTFAKMKPDMTADEALHKKKKQKATIGSRITNNGAEPSSKKKKSGKPANLGKKDEDPTKKKDNDDTTSKMQ
ncbi:hypothetical protein EJB05_53612, partial [Eragrostis curvula]